MSAWGLSWGAAWGLSWGGEPHGITFMGETAPPRVTFDDILRPANLSLTRSTVSWAGSRTLNVQAEARRWSDQQDGRRPTQEHCLRATNLSEAARSTNIGKSALPQSHMIIARQDNQAGAPRMPNAFAGRSPNRPLRGR